MATNLSIDPDLLERALEVSGERTKKAAVTKALQEFIARRRQKRLLELVGKLEWDEVTTTRWNAGAGEPVRGHQRVSLALRNANGLKNRHCARSQRRRPTA